MPGAEETASRTGRGPHPRCHPARHHGCHGRAGLPRHRPALRRPADLDAFLPQLLDDDLHNDNLIVLHAAALAAGPSADALSIDAWVRGSATGASGPHARYGWPLQLASATTVTTYALAGVAKLAGPLGWKWTSGESLRRQVAVDGVRKEAFASAASPLAYKLYANVALFRVLALGSMAIELLSPIALIDRRLARLWAFGAWQLHRGILAIMKIKFRYQLSGAAYASFLDFEKLIRR